MIGTVDPAWAAIGTGIAAGLIPYAIVVAAIEWGGRIVGQAVPDVADARASGTA